MEDEWEKAQQERRLEPPPPSPPWWANLGHARFFGKKSELWAVVVVFAGYSLSSLSMGERREAAWSALAGLLAFLAIFWRDANKAWPRE